MQKRQTYAELIELAKRYGVENNALFVAAAKQYELQAEVLEMMRKTLRDDGEATITKEYVKSRENVYVHPLIQQLPKHADSCNKTLQTMLDIIQKLGTEKAEADGLDEFKL